MTQAGCGKALALVGLTLALAASWGFAAPAASRPAGSRPAAPPPGVSDDPAVWPNRDCYRASEPWLVANHNKIRMMRPRALVLNFSNDVDMDGVRKLTEKFVAALAEGSRYHGYRDEQAPAFLQYEVAGYVDCRDNPIPAERAKGNSSVFPTKDSSEGKNFCDYDALFGDEFAKHYGFADPARPGRFLNLRQLIDAGLVHELWFYAVHEYEKGWPAFEVTEIKQFYDEQGKAMPGKYGAAGNGGDAKTFPWPGRSFRIWFFNPHRGTGCQIENFGHLLEGYANHDAIKAHTPYFREYAGLDLDKRYKLPFASLYAMPYDKRDAVSYPTPTSMKLTHEGKEIVVDPYVAIGGNNHFAPGACHHYDLSSPVTVKSTIESYRMGNGPDGKDLAADFNIKMTERFREVAPDCQGQWLIFWYQCMPGLNNKARDDDGKPMKNWWVYLFY